MCPDYRTEKIQKRALTIQSNYSESNYQKDLHNKKRARLNGRVRFLIIQAYVGYVHLVLQAFLMVQITAHQRGVVASARIAETTMTETIVVS